MVAATHSAAIEQLINLRVEERTAPLRAHSSWFAVDELVERILQDIVGVESVEGAEQGLEVVSLATSGSNRKERHPRQRGEALHHHRRCAQRSDPAALHWRCGVCHRVDPKERRRQRDVLVVRLPRRLCQELTVINQRP